MFRLSCAATAVLFASLALVVPAFADDYRAEVRAATARVENEGPDGKSFEIAGTYYFDDVGVDTVPLGEAAFLGRESSMSLSGRRAGADGVYSDYWHLDSEIYLPTRIPVFLAAGISRFETFRFDPGTFELVGGHDTAWDAAVGVTPLDGLRIATRFYEHGGYDPNVDLKYVGIAGNESWFGFGLYLQKPDEGLVYWGITADYFPSRTLRLGTSFQNGDDTIWLVVEKFFTSRASVVASYVTTSDGTDGFRIEGAWRF